MAGVKATLVAGSCVASLAAAQLALAPLAHAQAPYPSQPIRIVVPYPPGGGNDIPARLIGPELSKLWGQPVIVENRAGGSATIGANVVARAAPDGHTLLLTSAAHAVAPAVIPQLPYDPVKDFAGINMILSNPNVITVPVNSPIRSIQDLIARAKKEPGKISYGSVGIGSGSHILALTLEQAAGISLLHIPYKGGPQNVEAIVSGQLDTSFGILNSVMPSLRAGKLRALAVDERTTFLPDVPGLADAGYKTVTGKAFVAMFAPAATPRPVIQKLHGAVAEIMKRAPLREKFLAMAAEPTEMAPEQLDAFMRAQVAYYKDAIKRFNLPVEK